MLQKGRRFTLRGFGKKINFGHLLAAALAVTTAGWAGGLPVFITQPTNQIVQPGLTASLVAMADGATTYQWRFNGADLPGATNSVLQLTNAQRTSSGYYLALAKNSVGWVPSSMVYLSITMSQGTVPFSNSGNPRAQANYQIYEYNGGPITNGLAQPMAGPALDQMAPVGTQILVRNGYFPPFSPPPSFETRSVPTVDGGQTVFYRVDISYPFSGGSYTQQSTILKLVAGGGLYPSPSVTNLTFPSYIEWPDPFNGGSTGTSQMVVISGGRVIWWPGSYTGWGIPSSQCRKDGSLIGTPEAFTPDPWGGGWANGGSGLIIPNVQPSDAGVYDVVVIGNNQFISSKLALTVQLAPIEVTLNAPRLVDSNFICTLQGTSNQNYSIQWSPNLSDWNDAFIVTNAFGTVTFTNTLPSPDRLFYRARLVPQ